MRFALILIGLQHSAPNAFWVKQMADSFKIWDGDEWQDHVKLLVKRYYGPGEYVEVPDKDGGDCGLEGFSRTAGHLYQCYAANEPCSIAELTSRQQKKITRDLTKFVDNAGKLQQLFGYTKISRWILMVPHFDSKRLVEHTTKKTKEIREKQLPYTTEDFYVHVDTDECFEAEKKLLSGLGLVRTNIDVDPVEAHEISGWSENNPTDFSTLNTKVHRLPTLVTDEDRAIFRDMIITRYLEGQNALDKLNARFPEQYEQVRLAKAHRETFLAAQCMLLSNAAHEVLSSTLASFNRELVTKIIGISELTAERLTWGTVSDWMIRCPLRLPELRNGA